MIGDTRSRPCPRTARCGPGTQKAERSGTRSLDPQAPQSANNPMDISFNPRGIPVAPGAVTPRAESAPAKGADRPALTVTEALVSGDAAVEAVPESALRRDDELGRLFSAAFSLPPPPMPAFPS